ncbi:hypothetical protein KI387_035276, partial [Taxus chinensis]
MGWDSHCERRRGGVYEQRRQRIQAKAPRRHASKALCGCFRSQGYGLSSFFRPDFIITSFYRVFGSNPTGFGCLFIKKFVMARLQHKEGAAMPGVVRIVLVFPQYLSDDGTMDGTIVEYEGSSVNEKEEEEGVEFVPDVVEGGSQLPTFFKCIFSIS